MTFRDGDGAARDPHGGGEDPEDSWRSEDLDPRDGGRDPEDPRPGADAGQAPPGVRFAGEDAGDPPVDDVHETGTDRKSGPVHIPRDRRLPRESDAYHKLVSSGKVETYPADCYSFIAIHNPFVEPLFFFFGLMVFIFQMLFLVLMVLSIIYPKWRDGEVDNPTQSSPSRTFPWVGEIIPSNVNTLANLTQATAFLSYCIFSDSSLQVNDLSLQFGAIV
jgi:hypothetical protein